MPDEHQQDEHQAETPVVSHIKHPLVRAASLAGLIILLILGAWGIIRVALYLPTAFQNAGGAIVSPFSSLFAPRQSATTTAPALSVAGPAGAVKSDQPFTLSWNYANASAGDSEYKVSYACTNGFSLEAPLPTGSFQKVACDTPFNYTDAKGSITLIPHITGSQSEVSVPFSVSASNLASGTTTTASTLVAFAQAPRTGAQQPSASAGTGAQTVKGAARYAGPADLAVRILSVTPAGAQFEIRNIGGATVPAGWLFTAALPVSPSYTYFSAPQQALGAGSYIIYTLGWDGQTPQNCGYQYPYGQYPYQYQNYPYTYPQQNCYGNSYGSYYAGGTLTIVADARGLVQDANRANNMVSTVVR